VPIAPAGPRIERSYSHPSVRRALARRGVRAVVPRRRDQRPGDGHHTPLDRATYRERNRIERLIERLKQHRRVATRSERRASHYMAMLTIAATLLRL
jgi:transposase